MKHIKSFFFTSLLFFCARSVSFAQQTENIQNPRGQKLEILSCVKNSIIPFESFSPDENDYDDLGFLSSTLKDKKIVILGEADHGDGATFELKTRIIKFLVDQLGFNTIALEGGDFYGINKAVSNIQSDNTNNPRMEIYRSWNRIWSNSKQTQNFIDFLVHELRENNIDILGIENQPNNYYSSFVLASIKEYIINSDINTAFTDEDWDKMFKTYYSICRIDTIYCTEDRSTDLQSKINILMSKLSEYTENEFYADFYIQSLKNVASFIEMFKIGLFDYDSQNKGINIRDEQMFDNLEWYLKNNKSAKIIVWTASFHGAHNLDNITYTPDSDLYKKLKVFGEHVNDKYGKNAYSIASTSSEGYRGYIFQNDSSRIEIENRDFEYILSRNEHDYAFLDFSEINENNNCCDLKFKSQIFGNSHTGKWFSVFDGLFYIRRMYKSNPII